MPGKVPDAPSRCGGRVGSCLVPQVQTCEFNGISFVLVVCSDEHRHLVNVDADDINGDNTAVSKSRNGLRPPVAGRDNQQHYHYSKDTSRSSTPANIATSVILVLYKYGSQGRGEGVNSHNTCPGTW